MCNKIIINLWIDIKNLKGEFLLLLADALLEGEPIKIAFQFFNHPFYSSWYPNVYCQEQNLAQGETHPLGVY